MARAYKTDPESCVFYVYVHRKLTDSSIFYVGKGHGSRAESKSGRSEAWKETVEKNGYYIEYVDKNINESMSFDLERLLISELREIGAGICNKSSGGEGNSGMSHSEETKKKFRMAKLGKKQSAEHAEKSRTAKLGKKQPRDAVDYVISMKKKKIINSGGEIFDSASEASRVISKRIGTYVSQGNISSAARGERNNAYGFSWSYDLSCIPCFKETNSNAKSIVDTLTGNKFRSASQAMEWVKSWRGDANVSPITNSARTGEKAYGRVWRYE